MQVYFLIQALIISMCTLAVRAMFDSDELRNETIYKPAECNTKSKKFNFLTVHFTVSNSEGKVLASSLDTNEPVEFQLWKDEVIEGLEWGLLEMCLGEKRRLFVSQSLAYPRSFHKIPAPKEPTLIYEVELLKIAKVVHPIVETFRKADTNSDMQLSREEISAYWTNHIKREEVEGRDELERQKAKEMMGHRERNVDFIIEQNDADKDGIITREEYLRKWKDEL